MIENIVVVTKTVEADSIGTDDCTLIDEPEIDDIARVERVEARRDDRPVIDDGLVVAIQENPLAETTLAVESMT